MLNHCFAKLGKKAEKYPFVPDVHEKARKTESFLLYTHFFPWCTENLRQLQTFPEDDLSLDSKNPALGISTKFSTPWEMVLKYLIPPRFSNPVGKQVFSLIKYF